MDPVPQVPEECRKARASLWTTRHPEPIETATWLKNAKTVYESELYAIAVLDGYEIVGSSSVATFGLPFYSTGNFQKTFRLIYTRNEFECYLRAESTSTMALEMRLKKHEGSTPCKAYFVAIAYVQGNENKKGKIEGMGKYTGSVSMEAPDLAVPSLLVLTTRILTLKSIDCKHIPKRTSTIVADEKAQNVEESGSASVDTYEEILTRLQNL